MIKRVPAIDGNEIEKAEIVLFRKVQRECYLEEIIYLQKQKPIPRNSKIFNVCPYLANDQLIRLDSRLDVTPSEIHDEVKHPILLAKEHRITYLFIDAIHRKFHHTARDSVVNYIRQRVWIPKIRIAVNNVVAVCGVCAIRKSKPKIPRMSPLPLERLAPFKPPFTNTGLDFFWTINCYGRT